ncbi:hypothetical protein V7S43_005892 [Phytophthora oleae]|uniref:Uncharacterized protein n=1 Tax=Phytophthora oleae TaxID=2107226 RepID=A0ABD3FRL3_9STRA
MHRWTAHERCTKYYGKCRLSAATYQQNFARASERFTTRFSSTTINPTIQCASEKNKTDDGASAWIEKSKQLETEVEWTKELADRLDRLSQSLTRENQRLKTSSPLKRTTANSM